MKDGRRARLLGFLNQVGEWSKNSKKACAVGKLKVSDRMIAFLIGKARFGSYSAQENTGTVKKNFEVEIDVERIQQIISEQQYMK